MPVAITAHTLATALGCTASSGGPPPPAVALATESKADRDRDAPTTEEPLPRVIVRDSGNEPPGAITAWATRLRGRLATCKLAPGTVVQVRITRSDQHTRVELGPGLPVGDGADRCVRRALERIDDDDSFARTSPSDRASGFTALVEVAW